MTSGTQAAVVSTAKTGGMGVSMTTVWHAVTGGVSQLSDKVTQNSPVATGAYDKPKPCPTPMPDQVQE